MSLLSALGQAQTPPPQTPPERGAARLKRLTLEELSQIEVTSPGRKPERYWRTPTAISIITSDDIRRSGARSIPEVLRLATGLHVARFNNGTWAISPRGFNITTANKVQALMDGRSLYTPLFGGELWDVQDYPLSDIERIEVIRGPGATLWGANAVNGVINIVTKSSRDTQGGLVSAGAGNEEKAFGTLRYGGKAGSRGFYRAYARYLTRDSMIFSNGMDALDDFHFGNAGFRTDFQLSSDSELTLSGAIYAGRMGLFDDRQDIRLSGGHILGRWTRRFSPDSELQVQMYYDRTDRFVDRTFDEGRDNVDIDVQHRVHVADRHEIVWGGGFRASHDSTRDFPALFFRPPSRTISVAGGFVEDEIGLIPERLHLIVGSKFEHNTYTGFEVQPNVRLAFMPGERHNLWGAISRGVRIPTRFDTELRIPLPNGLLIRGDRDFQSEEVLAYEIGYRVQPHPRFSLDLATFVHDYDNLRSQEFTPPAEIVLRNLLRGKTWGLEASGALEAAPWWRLQAGWTNLQQRFRFSAASVDTTGGRSEAADPRNQFQLRSMMDLGRNVELDFWTRHVSRLRHPSTVTPAYTVFDVRLGWRPTDILELSVVGQNLPSRSHVEFGSSARPQAVERGVYGQIRWLF